MAKQEVDELFEGGAVITTPLGQSVVLLVVTRSTKFNRFSNSAEVTKSSKLP
jgi:hypothetical protein